MPKITIKTLPLNKSIDIPQVLKKLGNDLADVQKKSTHHPIVEVAYVEGMSGELEKKMVQTIVRILNNELEVDSDNICVVLNTLKPGKLFVSGKFKEKSVKNQLQ